MSGKQVGRAVIGAVASGLAATGLAATGLIVVALVGNGAPAQAATIALHGHVEFVDPSSPLGVAVGDVVSGSATFNEALVAPVGLTILDFSSGTPFGLINTIGNQTFVAGNDVYFPAFPDLFFVDGTLTHIDFFVKNAHYTYYVSKSTNLFRVYDSLGVQKYVQGHWFMPVPAALPLFASAIGVLGAALFRRRAG